MCKRRCERIPKVGKLPAPSRHRSPALSQTVRGSRRNPISVSRWSKICPIVQRRQHVCKRPCVTGYRRSENCPSPSCHHPESDATCAPVRVATSRVDPPTTCWPTGALAPWHDARSSRGTQGSKTACAVTLSFSDTLAECAREPPHSRRCFSMVQNRRRRPTPLSRAVANSGATSATGPRYFQAGRPYPHQLPAPPLMQVAMRSAPSTRPSVSIACVASDVHACGRSVYFGRGDAERARI